MKLHILKMKLIFALCNIPAVYSCMCSKYIYNHTLNKFHTLIELYSTSVYCWLVENKNSLLEHGC